MREKQILVACLAFLATLPVAAAVKPELAQVRTVGSGAADPQSGWTLIWSDEFDVLGAPNPEFWSHEVNCWGGGNNEYQCYTDRLDNSYVGDDGLLHIVAKEETFSGPSRQDDDPGYPGPTVTRNYTSARLRTRDKVDWKYGRIEIRARVPGGRGMWPAIWMLPTDWVYGGWPSSGEIDIMEAVNLARGSFRGWGNYVHGTLHYGLPWPQWENHGRPYFVGVNPADGFHEYALEWEADEIRWYVDGVHYQTQTSAGWYNYIWGGQATGFVVANPRAPFDQRFHLLLNVAVGGDWPGPPDRNWDGDREMLVDYVRVYQCASGSAAGTGQGCATIDPAVEVHEDAGTPGVNDYLVYDDDFKAIGATTLVPASFAASGVTVDSTRRLNGAWEVEFARSGAPRGDFLGNVSLRSADRTRFVLDGGSGWTNNGELEFDIKLRSIDPGTRLFVKMDSGDREVGVVELEAVAPDRRLRLRRLANGGDSRPVLFPATGDWHHVAVKVADLLANRNPEEAPLDVRNVRNVFMLESTGPAHVWMNNIRLQCAFNTEPEWWQIDKTCDLRPKTRHRFSDDRLSATPAPSTDRLSLPTTTTSPPRKDRRGPSDRRR